MAVDIEEYRRLKARVEELTNEAAKAQGAYEATMANIKKEYGVDTIEDAEELAAELEAKATEAEERYDKAIKRFKREYGNILDPDS